MKLLKYKVVIGEENQGTEEQPDIVPIIQPAEFECKEEHFDSCYARAKEIAYNGEVTVEEVSDPEPTISEQIAALKAELSSTDYKIIKCSEAQLVGDIKPYDIVELHAERQALRDKINELESQLEGSDE